MIEIDRHYVEIFTEIAKGGAISYGEIKRLNAFEFFYHLQNHLDAIDKKSK